MNIADYQIGDIVLIRSEDHGKKVIGCIEEIDEHDKSFVYGMYLLKANVPLKQYYHGNYEVFKTSNTHLEKLKNIEKYVEVLNFKEYVMREQPTPERPFYVSRQYYDVHENTLTPESLKPCICNKIVNPDQIVGICNNCRDFFYHEKCVSADSKCLECESNLKDDSIVGHKRSHSDLNFEENSSLAQSKLKSKIRLDPIEEEETEEIESSKMKIDTYKMKKMLEQVKTINDIEKKKQSKIQHLQGLKNTNLQKSTIPSSKNKENLLEYKNLNVQQNEKIKVLVNRFKKFNPIGSTTGPDKKRMEVREKFFEYIVYGLIEFKSKDIQLNDEERKLLSQDLYEIGRKLAVEIESHIFIINNRQNNQTLTENYKQRCKLLFSNLKDPLNFNLRRKIINKTYKASMLCTMPEIQMYNPTKFQEVQDQKMKLLNRDTIHLNDKMYILKTNKGEEIIDLREEKQDVEDEEFKGEEQCNVTTDIVQEKSNSCDSNEYHVKNNQNNFSDQSTLDEILDQKECKNYLADHNIVDSLLSYIGDKALKRMTDRLNADLPEKYAKYLSEKLIN